MEDALLRKNYPFFDQHPDLIYFDNAATALKPRCVIDALVRYYEKESVNVHRSAYPLAQALEKRYEQAREQVASFLHAQAEEIIFTGGTTAAMNQLAYALLPQLTDGDVILTTYAEHASCILPFLHLKQFKRIEVAYIPLDAHGRFSLPALKASLHSRVKAVVLAEIGNVLGYRLPLAQIAELVHEAGALLFVDGAQSAAYGRTDVKASKVDAFACSAHKLGATTGVGALYLKKELFPVLQPAFYGGTSNCDFDEAGHIVLCEGSAGYEAGTPPIEGAIAFGEACAYLQKIGLDVIEAKEQQLKEHLFAGLKKIAHVTLWNEDSAVPIAAFTIDHIHVQDAAAYFAKHGVCLRSGQHCARLLKQAIDAKATLRVSLAFYNTIEEIDRFLALCEKITLDACVDLYME